jgi:tRNA pseudouridine38-40 synthase
LVGEVRNIRLTLQYDGTDFHGFQRQVGVPTIQEAVEQKLERITGAPTAVVGAGRTDAGVHATGQVINFRTEGAIPTERVCMALNSLPPYSIVARGAREVEPEFHARFDATSRSYRYVILRGDPSPFLRRYAWRVTVPLDVAQMREAAGALVGRFDFAAFCAAGAEVRSTVREIRELRIAERGRLLWIDVTADGFLHSMVRIIVGTLVEIGSGARPARAMAEIRDGRDRGAAGPTAPPHGLYLTRVRYEKAGV